MMEWNKFLLISFYRPLMFSSIFFSKMSLINVYNNQYFVQTLSSLKNLLHSRGELKGSNKMEFPLHYLKDSQSSAKKLQKNSLVSYELFKTIASYCQRLFLINMSFTVNILQFYSPFSLFHSFFLALDKQVSMSS